MKNTYQTAIAGANELRTVYEDIAASPYQRINYPISLSNAIRVYLTFTGKMMTVKELWMEFAKYNLHWKQSSIAATCQSLLNRGELDSEAIEVNYRNAEIMHFHASDVNDREKATNRDLFKTYFITVKKS